MNVQEVMLELSKGTVPGQIVRLGQGDIGGTTIRAVVYDGGTEADLTGAQASFLIRLPDGRHYVRDANCTASGNVITYVVDEAHCCLASGYTDEAYFEFTKDGRTYSTSRFRVKIERAANDGAEIPPGSWDTAVDAAIDAANAAAGLANAAATNADATADGVEARVQQMADEAAESAASQVEDRVEGAIEAMGDISELAVPEMSADVRGGAKLEQHGGLALRDGSLGIGSLVQESDGYARGGLAQVTAKGHAEQISTTGKNLARTTFASTTADNLVLTKVEDFCIRVSGSTGSNNYGAGVSNNFTLSSGTYTLSMKVDGTSNGAIYPRLYKNNAYGDKIAGVGDESDDFSLTFTLDADTDMYLSFGVLANKTVDCTVRIQLELGSTVTEYEPYTGGAPSPSPDYPQEIQVVRGRNLIDTTAVTSGKYLASGGTVTDGATYSISDYVPVEVGATYVTSGMGAVSSAYYAWYNSSKTYISATQQTANGFTLTAPANAAYVRVSLLNASLGSAQLELGSTPQPYVPYGHVGMEVKSRNLLPHTDEYIKTVNGMTFTSYGDGSYRLRGKATAAASFVLALSQSKKLPSETLYVHLRNDSTTPAGTAFYIRTSQYSGNVLDASFTAANHIVQISGGSTIAYVAAYVSTGNDVDVTFTPSIERTNSPTSYSGFFSDITTPIPLPQRGWVAGLPDGTADSLTLDGAGKCEWELADAETTTAATDGVTGTIGVDVLSTTGQIADGTTVLYPLATPVTEDCGYVEDWPTDLPEGATVTISELDSVGIKYFIDSSVTELAKQWYARANSEYADRITALEQAVAELATS